MNKYKVLTHGLAVAVAAVAAFFVSPAGVALIHQYPTLAPISAGLAMILSLYHNPKNSA